MRVEVEVDVANGLPCINVVGLPEGAVREGRERVTAALHNSGFAVPPKRVTVNLAPADVRKDGSAFDLAIAMGILAATGMVSAEAAARFCFLGELGLDGVDPRRIVVENEHAQIDPVGGDDGSGGDDVGHRHARHEKHHSRQRAPQEPAA